MPPQQKIFTDDLVMKDGQIGLVERAPNSSDEEDEDDDIISDEAPNADKLPAGAAKVHWAKTDEPVTEFIDELRLTDRVFLLGDIVSRSDAQLGQTGVVVGMRMYCDVRCNDGMELPRVPTELLQPLTSCRPGALVLHTQFRWLGRVDEVYDNVNLSFDDGASCKVMRTSANSLSVQTPSMDEQTWFWPSMRVGVSKETLRRAKWLKGSWRAAYATQSATVTRVQAAQALVRWLAAVPSEGSEPAATIHPPADMQRPSRLLELHHHHARRCWRLGEHAALRPEDLQRLRAEGEAASEAAGAAGDRQTSGPAGGRRGKRKLSAVESCVEAVGCHTRVDVIWQDGSRERDAAATLFAPAKHVDGYNEFWPQDFVVRKVEAGGGAPAAGVVLSVNHAERIAVVSWRLSAEEAERAAEYANEAGGGTASQVEERTEVVPVYDIAPHPDFGFKVGDVVLRLPMGEKDTPMPAAGREVTEDVLRPAGLPWGVVQRGVPDVADADQVETAPSGGVAAPAEPKAFPGAALRILADAEADGEDGADDGAEASPDGGLSALGWVGEVVDVGPTVSVRWMDGTQSQCVAESLYMVNTEEEPGEEEVGSFDEGEGEAEAPGGDAEVGEGSSGWETVDSEASDGTTHAARSREASGTADRAQRRSAFGGSAARRQDSDAEMEEMNVSSDEDEPSSQARAARAALESMRSSAVWSARLQQAHPLSAALWPGPVVPASIGSSEDEANYATAEELDEEVVAAMDEDWPPGGQGGTGATAADRGGGGAGGGAAAMVQTEAAHVHEASGAEAAAASCKAEARPASGAVEEEEEDLYSHRAIESAGFSQFRVVEEDDGPNVSTFHSFANSSPFAAPTAGPSAAPAEPGPGSAAALPAVGTGAASPTAGSNWAGSGTAGSSRQPVYPAAFSKVAQKQWKLLATGLPQGIYVVAFASRTDLLRALIIGPPGTPYQDAVFVFDLQLSPEFPTQPPAVQYLSYGERINPNLYENGKVCLSLLGTWTGRQSCELWNPQSSTVLQVLVSIQALVLCEQPYFNEAGYERQLGTSDGAHHARRYNEGALLLSLKSISTSLRNSAQPFDGLISVHFSTASRRILRRCAWLLRLKKPLEQAALATAAATAGSSGAPASSSTDGAASSGAANVASSSAGASDAQPAAGEGGAAVADAGEGGADAVSRAGLKGVLNAQPTLGFLYSLDRMLPALERTFAEARPPAAGGQ